MSQFPFWGGQFGIPTMSTTLEGVENQPWFGKWEQQAWFPGAISGAARDAGNTVTTVLRPGLILGRVLATGLLKEWDITATDGSDRIFGVLGAPIRVTDSSGTNLDRYVGFVQVAGTVYSDRLIIPGESTEGIVGKSLEFEVEAQMTGRFVLDRHVEFHRSGAIWTTVRNLPNSNVTLTENDRNILWSNALYDATRTVSLPNPKRSLRFLFYAPVQKITLSAPGGASIVADDNNTNTYQMNPGSILREFLEITGISTTVYLATRHEKNEV